MLEPQTAMLVEEIMTMQCLLDGGQQPQHHVTMTCQFQFHAVYLAENVLREGAIGHDAEAAVQDSGHGLVIVMA